VYKEPECGLIWSLQVITLEGWVEIMYYVMDAHSFYNFIYFIFLIIVSFLYVVMHVFRDEACVLIIENL